MKALPPLLQKVWMRVAENYNFYIRLRMLFMLSAIILPCSLNAGSVSLVEQRERCSNGGAVLVVSVNKSLNGSGAVLNGGNLISKSCSVVCGNAAQCSAPVAPKSQPMNGKRDKQRDRHAQEVDGFYLMALLFGVSVWAACAGMCRDGKG